MILLGNQTLPIGIPCKEIWWNSIFLCPITGEIWARIDRGRRTWSSETRPREGACLLYTSALQFGFDSV